LASLLPAALNFIAPVLYSSAADCSNWLGCSLRLT